MLEGFLSVDKPPGMTSHDVVDVIRRLTGCPRVGHTGTLDPDATGVLLLGIGRATKFVRFCEGLDKTYWAVVRLGMCTDTQDASGVVLQQVSVPPLACADVQQVLRHFTGKIQQIPPMYSAVKYHGRRLYQLARQGRTVTRQAREVVIHRLELLDLRDSRLTLAIQCSKGTYIRSLGEDIGMALGYGGYIEHLQRCRVGPFSLRCAYALEFLQKQAKEGRLGQCIVPIEHALEFLPGVPITVCQLHTLSHGGRAAAATLQAVLSPLGRHVAGYRLCSQTGKTEAVVQCQASAEAWQVLLLD